MSDAPNHSYVGRFSWAALWLFLFGVVEAILGAAVVHNPAVVADAGHNLADSLVFVLVLMLIEWLASRAKSHWFGCTFRRIAGISVLAITVVLIGLFTITEAGHNQSHLVPWLVMLIALASFGLNYGLGRGLASGESATAKGLSNHLYVDSAMAGAIFVMAPIAYWVGSAKPNAAAAIIILALVAVHNTVEIWEQAKEIHRAENHHKTAGRDNHSGHVH